MAVTKRFRIEGMEHALRQFKRAPDLAKKFIGEAVQRTEESLSDRVFDAAPKRTGLLRLSIQSKTTGLNARIYIEPGAYYWRFVEFGTVHHAAQPFIRPTAETEQEPMIQRIRDAGAKLERALD